MPNVRTITHDGQSRSLQGWAEATGIPAGTIASRLNKGWAVARALTERPDRRFAKGGRPRADAPRRCPELKEHAAKGAAYVRWHDGDREQWRYFGPWGSDEARAGYRRFALEWAGGGPPGRSPAGETVLLGDVAAAWIAHCERTYVKRGRITSEVHCNRAALLPLSRLYGAEAAADFDARKLRAVREAMVEGGWVRKTVNDHVARIVRAFGWAVTEKLVPLAVHQELLLVEPLSAGRRDDLAEGEPVDPVPHADVLAVLAGAHLHPKRKRRAVLAAMVRLQLLTGMRPGELCGLRADQIDRAREPWRYGVTEYNKMLHKDVTRDVFFGPEARAVLGPLLAACGPADPVFGFPPWRAKADWSPITTARYRNRVRLACLSAGVPVWTPNRLRHNRATEVMDRYEDDRAVAAVLGNSPEVARQVYAKNPGHAVARRIAEATG